MTMQTSTHLSQVVDILEPVVSFTTSRTVQNNAFRLDATSYAKEVSNNFMALITDRPTERLGTLGNVFGFGPFKRIYIASSDYGVPMLTSSEMMELAPEPNIMAKVDCPKWEQYQIQRGWILVSCSGTIGNVALVPEYWNGWAISQDAIRVVPSHENKGLIWTFLLLPAVKSIIISKKSGSVVDHIYKDDVANLELPLVSGQVKVRLNELYDKVLDLMEASRKLHDDSISAVMDVNFLPSFGAAISKDVETMPVSSSTVITNGDYRLDAQFYHPTAQLAIANIKKCRSEIKTVGDVADQVFFCNRFTRTFVDKHHGVPYLAGKNIIQTRPTDLAYLSRTQTDDLDQFRLQKGWILMTCSGTIGRTCLVWKNYEEYVGTHDLIRIVPETSQMDGGYLYAFLSSDYGKQQVLRYRHGSVIDHVTPEQVQRVLVPCPSRKEQTAIGNKVREAYEKRAEAISLEDDAQAILMRELTKASGTKGV